jgi:hypothetical protein
MNSSFEEKILKQQLGEGHETLQLGSSSEHAIVAAHMIEQATLRVDIISRTLDARIYDQARIIEGMKTMIRNQNRAEIRIIVRDSGPMVRDGHRVLLLAQRLNTFIRIRALPRHYHEYNTALTLIDDSAYIRQPIADLYEAEASFNDKRTVRDLRAGFEDIWHSSEADPACRRISL